MSHARLLDISVLVQPGTPEWPGDTPYDCQWAWRIAAGASVNVSAIHGSPHVGTHADAPLHVRDGWAGAEALPLPAFAGRVHVVHVDPALDVVRWHSLALNEGEQVDRLLIGTGCTIALGAFPDRWPVLDAATLDRLLKMGLRLLGVDAPSVDARESKALANHVQLFTAGAYILENLDLRHVPAGTYDLMAFPLKLGGLDAAPVRAVLRPLEPGDV